PIDQHLKGFKAMGIRIERSRDGFYLQAEKVKGAKISFDVITSGATVNMILASVKAEGETILQNAARDPEVVDLCNLLMKMGAKIYGAGTDTIRIIGVKKLRGAEHTIIPDRLMAGTFLIAGLATDGAVEIRNVIPEHLTPLLRKLEEMNARFHVGEESLYTEGIQSLKATRVRTGMYPAFATDLQQPLTALMLKAKGRSIVTETVYPNRFSHLPELLRMGARIERREATALIRGGISLTGADVKATDVRAGLALLIAGMMAEGETRLFGVEHMERGMEDLVPTFHRLHVPIEIREAKDLGEEMGNSSMIG
ncbi:MAG: UDP-N-acetylglucosamine 1-carboxyvinyltransferase, partial [Thermicanus sp.]|nr:UDP-N-acetylglucosamine 1-carboxyvinyltransferase [Thermicanus sp.]